ncbi:MAG: hypothetical protein IPQ07_21895, partial [Myxococcales bacterium]|nr:hypothetical protein [Myxococcales bacterium]
MAERRRRIVRFFGPRNEMLVAESPNLVLYDASGTLRFRTEVEDLLDVVAVGEELWAVSPGRVHRLALRDGHLISSEPIDALDATGRFMQSSTAPHLPVWHAAQPVWLRASPARIEIPGPGGELLLPITDGRWMLWQAGRLRMWRTIGEAWRTSIGEPGSKAFDAQLVLDGRMFVLTQQKVARAGESDGELRLSVVAVNDGAQVAQMRLPGATQLAIAARRGVALARAGERLSLIDLRFGRWIRDLTLPSGIIDFAVDDGLQHIALGTPDGIELVTPDALPSPVAQKPQVVHDEAVAATGGDEHPGPANGEATTNGTSLATA